jgi:hypothetical protein
MATLSSGPHDDAAGVVVREPEAGSASLPRRAIFLLRGSLLRPSPADARIRLGEENKRGKREMIRLLLLAAVVSAIVGATGCIGFGPKNDRLYVAEWKGKKQRPVKLDKSWEYEGEHWEKNVPVDSAQ